MRIAKPNACISCYGACWGMDGFVPSTGTGANGVLIVGEAAGADEAEAGVGWVGKSGFYLWSNLGRAGIDREGFKVANVLACQPFGIDGKPNSLVGQPFEKEVIAHCSPNLDAAIVEMQEICAREGKHLTMVCLGKTAFKRVLDLPDKSPIWKEEYLAYPFRSEKYQAWVYAADHPSYLMRGAHNLLPILQYTVKRALEVAAGGLLLDTPTYLLDTAPETFAVWVGDYLRNLATDPTLTLSYDIETPMKQGKDEAKLAKEDGDDYTILRISFCYGPTEAISVPWTAPYLPYIQEALNSGGTLLGWNNTNYDDARILHQIPMRGERVDGMVAWHVLNSALPKSLGFVTPFYWQTGAMWKHLAKDEPAKYNAIDALACWHNYQGIVRDLKANNLWEVYNTHVLQMNRVLSYMSEKGVLRDDTLRQDSEVRLSTILDGIESKMDAAVPQEARRLRVWRKQPKDTTGMVEVAGVAKVSVCPQCGEQGVTAPHFKSVGKKRLKAGEVENLCFGYKPVKQEVPAKQWASPLPWKVSKVGLTNYQQSLRHEAIVNRKENKTTFDESAMMRLMKKYPKDPLYPLIIEHRGVQKLSGYIGTTNPTTGKVRGGMPVGRDGRIHCLFTRNPSTLRSACQEPNLQQLQRPGGPDDLATIIRNLIIAAPGHTLLARDFSGIEGVITAYLAMCPGGIRLARQDIHTFYTAYALHELGDGRVPASDLPLLSWDDDHLFGHLAHLKKLLKHERNSLYKHLVHAANFGQGAKGAAAKIYLETGIEYPTSLVQKVMDIYFNLFPEIKRWHWATLLQVERDGYLRNPFGYVHRFSKPFDYEKIGGKWQKRQGPQANEIWAFGPQSSAMGIIVEAMMRLYFHRFEEAGQWMRLLVHDEIFSEVPEAEVDSVDAIMKEEMERPILSMPLPTSYGMGTHLTILTEGKRGPRWGEMH